MNPSVKGKSWTRGERPVSQLQLFVFRLVAVTFIGLGFVQSGHAGIVTTQDSLTHAQSQQNVAEIHNWLARDEVAKQLVAMGVEPASVLARINNLTDAEISTLHSNIETQVAGGDALGVIGALFIVLLILELVGVTDIFKSF